MVEIDKTYTGKIISFLSKGYWKIKEVVSVISLKYRFAKSKAVFFFEADISKSKENTVKPNANY